MDKKFIINRVDLGQRVTGYEVFNPGVNGGEAAASDVYADDFLYDMQKDPWQLNNVVADPAYADVKAELRERLLNWIQHAEGTRPTITD